MSVDPEKSEEQEQAAQTLVGQMIERVRNMSCAIEAQRVAIAFLCDHLSRAGMIQPGELDQKALEYAAAMRALPKANADDFLISESLIIELRSAFGLPPESMSPWRPADS